MNVDETAGYYQFLQKQARELTEGYNELRIAALDAIQIMPSGDAKANLRDAYDKATEQLDD